MFNRPRAHEIPDSTLAHEAAAARRDLLLGRGVDHVGVVRRDLIVQRLRRVEQQVPVLVDGASLYRHLGPEGGERPLQPGGAIDDQELRRPQATGHQPVENRAPGGLALTAHGAHRERHLLPVAVGAEHHQQRDGGGLAVEAGPHHRAVQDQPDDALGAEVVPAPSLPIGFHLAPGPADNVLADCAAEQCPQGAPDPPSVGAGEVSASDQRLVLPRPPGVAGQHGAKPLPRGAVLGPQPRPRHRQRHRTELPRPLAEDGTCMPIKPADAMGAPVWAAWIASRIASPCRSIERHRRCPVSWPATG